MWAGGGGRGSPQRPPEGGVESRRRLGPHREPGGTRPCDLSPRVEVTFGQGSQSVQGDLPGASEGNHNPDLPPFPPHWPRPTERWKVGAHDEAGGGEASVWTRPGAGAQLSACTFKAHGTGGNKHGTTFHGVSISSGAISRMKFIFKNQCKAKGDSFFQH